MLEALLQNGALTNFGCLKGFDFLPRGLVRGGGGNGNRGGSVSDRCSTWIDLGVLTGVIVGATGIGASGALGTVTVEVAKFSEDVKTFSGLLDVCTLDPASMNFELISETVGAEGKLLLSVESGDQSRIT